MHWEELTGGDFEKAVAQSRGVCLLSMGVIERHGPHLPLGTDMINGQFICEQAAKREKAVVFPPWFLGQIYEARCFPGTVNIPPVLLVELMLAIMDEIGRNGFTKIIIFVAHGGNNYLAPFLSQCLHSSPRPYSVYVVYYDCAMTAQEQEKFDAVLDVAQGGHADEQETSMMLAHRPELVKMEYIAKHPGAKPLGRMNKLVGGAKHFYSPIGWYSNYPEHYAGDARQSTAQKGRKMVEIAAGALARFIKRVKDDTVAPALEAEFWAREGSIRKNSSPQRAQRTQRKAKRG